MYAPQHRSVGVDDHIVSDDGVAWNAFDGVVVLVIVETLGAEGHSLVEFHVVANDGGGSNHHSCAVVNREMLADGCPGVYVDARF